MKLSTKPTLIAVGAAAIWILILHTYIVFWAMSEPARVEGRIDARQSTRAHAGLAAANPQSPAQAGAAQTAAAPDAQGGSASADLPRNPAVAWTHVAFPAVLLGSCVAIFASLIWAAVALNREYD